MPNITAPDAQDLTYSSMCVVFVITREDRDCAQTVAGYYVRPCESRLQFSAQYVAIYTQHGHLYSIR